MNEFKISGTVKTGGSLTGGLSMPQGSVMNDYEKLINKPLVFDSSTNFPPTGNAERLYIATNVNKIYYWTGTTYADISGSGGGTGTDGKSPYIHANGNWYVYNDVLHAWVDTGVRAEGKDGLNGADGKDGTNGINGLDGANGIDGIDGKSAYEIAVENGFIGAESEWLESLKGTDGTNGINGTDGTNGIDGKSAYQTWLDSGYTGTELEFLASLKGIQGDVGYDGEKGEQGETGKSAYEIAVIGGFTGTEAEWIASLKGNKGDKGEDGYTPTKGTDYFTPADIDSLGINPTITTDLTPTTQTVTLSDNTEYRYGALTSLTITWTASDIRCSMAFTGGVGVIFSITAGTKIVGTDVTDGVFAPVEDKRYNLGFEFDGVNRTVYVSGVS